MSNKIRWGLLSTARINRALLPPLRHSARSELVAVASRQQAKADAYAAKHGIPKAYGSYDALLADPDIDVIYNPLPNGLHAEWTIKAANAGKHVLCEKPLVVSLEEWDAVNAAASRNNVTIFEAFMYLHHPQTQTIKAMIQAGDLGEIQTINSWFHFYLPPADSKNVRLNTKLAGGSLWDVGVYPNSLAIVMADSGSPVAVWGQQALGETGVEVAMQAQMRFANGVNAQISSSFRTPFRQGAEIVGSDALLSIPEPWKPGSSGKDSIIYLTRRDNSQKEIVIPAIDPYLCEVQAMEACILDGREPVVPLSLSRDFLITVLALYRSAASGKVVELPR